MSIALRSTVKYLSTSLRVFVLGGLFLFGAVAPAAAQNYGMDARVIGMGAIGSTRNLASGLVKEVRPYRRIGLPIGLLQVLGNQEVFKPDVVNDRVSREFDLFRAMEYASSPLNYTFGRDDSGTGQALVNDVINDELKRDLNFYRGFRPTTKLTAEGVGQPSWGWTFKKRPQGNDQMFHGIYVGAGPYLTVTTETLTDPALADLLGSPVPVFVPRKVFNVNHETEFQAATAIIGGYRFSRTDQASTAPGERVQGLFVAANFNYLVGLDFAQVDMDIQFETNAAGLIVTDNEKTTTPLKLDLLTSRKGRGASVDAGVIYAIDRWDFGAGVNGIGNRIKWTDVERRTSVEDSLMNGNNSDNDEFDPVPAPDLTLELPINYSGNVGYHADKWVAAAEYSRRFNGNNFQSGLEYLVNNRLAVRGGGRYARDRWFPATGIGYNLTPGFGIDVAVFGTSTNLERRRHATLAVSLRFNKLP